MSYAGVTVAQVHLPWLQSRGHPPAFVHVCLPAGGGRCRTVTSVSMTGGSADGRDSGWLGEIPLFEGMAPAELERISTLGTRVEVPHGEVLVDQGDPGTYCYAIAEGIADVFVSGEYVATVGRGSTIGEMALIDHRPRTATVVANGAMVLVRFDTRAFKELLDSMPKASERIHAILASRLDG